MRWVRALMCAPVGIAAMTVYASALGGASQMNGQQLGLALLLTIIPSALCLTFKDDEP